MTAARKNRYGHRDATMILVTYRHGLRATEVCQLRWVEGCGRYPSPEVAVQFGRRRGRQPLHSVDFVDGSFIPIRDIAGSEVHKPASPAHDVRN